MKILVSRTDSIGDVVLTLPLCGWIKKNILGAEVHFLCQALTEEVIAKSKYVDHVHIWDGRLPAVDVIIHVFPRKEIARAAKKSKIRTRIGTSHRLIHLATCNKRVHFSRIRSSLHESQLNFELLRPLGLKDIPNMGEMQTLVGWQTGTPMVSDFLPPDKFNVIFHIKSRGSAKEWKSTNYLALANLIASESINIVLTGTQAEGELIKEEIPEIFDLEHVTDTTGQLSLGQLVQLIEGSEGLLACSTGPLHIAGVSGTKCLGIYPSKRPMHPGRWSPLGRESQYLEERVESKSKYLDISVDEVLEKLINWWK